MSSYPPPSASPDSIAQAAAAWVMRRDRGLTAAEQDELSQWLAVDPRHGEALALHRWGWDELDRLTGLQTSLRAVADPDLLAPGRDAERMRSRLIWFTAPLLAAAACVVILHFGRTPAKTAAIAAQPVAQSALAAPCERRELEDGASWRTARSCN
jgi:transmembrane sensor